MEINNTMVYLLYYSSTQTGYIYYSSTQIGYTALHVLQDFIGF